MCADRAGFTFTPTAPTDLARDARLTSLDAFRGLVMLLLIPDVHGGFSFYRMVAQDPDNATWAALARLFTHSTWAGCTPWDLIMPAFVFLAGVSMPYSYAARKRRGDSPGQILRHALLRSAALLLLGIELLTPIRTWLDALWPFLLLALGLPVPSWLAQRLPRRSSSTESLLRAVWWGTILSASFVRVTLNLERIDLQLHDILPQLALAYVFAYALIGRGRRAQAATVAAILVLYWLAFSLYPLPPPGIDLASVGATRPEETFGGFFAHWNRGTNLAAAFDAWFLNLFPRATPYVFAPHGYQTLNFVPTIATLIMGVMTGEWLRGGVDPAQKRNVLFLSAGAAIAGGLLLGWILCPIVKSICTPSWTLFSAGWVLLGLGVFYHLLEPKRRRAWAFPLVVAGSNPILLYVLALNYGWSIVGSTERLFGPNVFAGYAGPVIESIVTGATLWFLAFLLHRLRIHVRL